MDKVPMTLAGFKKMQEELKKLKNIERPQVISAIAAAREYGDLSENAEYHAAKEKQGMIEARILDIENKISRATVVDPTGIKSAEVRFGATVVLVNSENGAEQTFQIVGSDEADIKNGLLPITAPLSKALISKVAGDSIEVASPGGVKSYIVKEIKYL